MGKVTGRTALGSMTPEMLVIGNKHPLDVIHVTVAAGQGPLKRGTVLAEDASGECYILGTEGCTAAYILAEDMSEGEEDETVVTAYRCGDFNKGALKVKEGYKITAEDIRELRYGGIYLGNAVKN